MPSWNIHIAQTERLLARGGAVADCVRDRNAFLLGNVVPDIYVGYMVPGVADPIPYRVTHFAKPEPIPKPREHEFWDAFVKPLLRVMGEGAPATATTLGQERERLNRVHYPRFYEGAEPVPEVPASELSCEPLDIEQSVLDLTLGVWAHLVADNVWNTRVNEFLDAHGGKPSEEFRIKKQGDFDWFGKTLAIGSVPRATDRLAAACARFPQYPIAREYVLKAIGVMHEIVRENPGDAGHPPYRLLTEEFFDTVFAEVVDLTEYGFAERVANRDGAAEPLIESR